MKRQQVTPEMLKMMDPKVAAQYGYLDKLMPKGSFGEPNIPRLERAEHAVFQNWLLAHGYAFQHSRCDKRTRDVLGTPDFLVFEKTDGVKEYFCVLALAIEFKVGAAKLSKVQEEWHSHYGGVVHVVDTAVKAIQLVEKEFGQ